MTLEETIRRAVRDEIERADLVRLVSEAVVARLVAVPAAEEYLTTSQAARIAKVDPDTIRKWTKAGLINRYGDGRLRIKESELRAYIEIRKTAEPSGNQVVANARAAARRIVG